MPEEYLAYVKRIPPKYKFSKRKILVDVILIGIKCQQTIEMGRDWLFTEEQLTNTPSRRDGIDRVEEDRLRREGIKFIVEIGSGLKL